MRFCAISSIGTMCSFRSNPFSFCRKGATLSIRRSKFQYFWYPSNRASLREFHHSRPSLSVSFMASKGDWRLETSSLFISAKIRKSACKNKRLQACNPLTLSNILIKLQHAHKNKADTYSFRTLMSILLISNKFDGRFSGFSTTPDVSELFFLVISTVFIS